MNSAEKEMLELLKKLRGEYSVHGLKTEFEAEGARLEEVLRLKELCAKADLALTLKIGGCEAVSDMHTAQSVGVDAIVAPMIESAFALKKFVDVAKSVYTACELESLELRVNVESLTGAKNFDEMLGTSQFDRLSGIVIGRKDLALSMESDNVDDDRVIDCCREIFTKARCQKPKMQCSMGGMITPRVLPLLKEFTSMVSFFETRKVIYQIPEGGITPKMMEGVKKGYEFEMLWYKTKHGYYQAIAGSDDNYMKRVEAAYALFA